MSRKSTNFNTSSMKVAIFDVKEEVDIDIIDKESHRKIVAMADYCLERSFKKSNNIKAFVIVNPQVIYTYNHAGSLATHLKKAKAKILSTVGSTLVIESRDGFIITIEIVGGAMFVADDCYDSNSSMENEDDDESDFEDAGNIGLTQECNLRI